MRLRRVLSDWRNWWNLGLVAFIGWFLALLLRGAETIATVTGPAANREFSGALGANSLGFALLHLEQESGSAD